ncbi:BatD family protein [bacterium]|nr:BatD family protein [bacterium]
MKRSLGKLVVLLILSVSGWGATYQWKTLEAPQSLYVHQSGVVRYECSFSTNAADYTIDFKPAGNESYRASILTQRDRIVAGKRIQTFDVLITPVKEGKIDVSLEALIRHTTFASIENASIGRDNVKKYDFDDEKAPLPKVMFIAKPNSAALSGELTLEVQIDKRSAVAHEPVHVSLYLRGKGNLDQYPPYELNISGVTVFAEEPIRDISPDSAGYVGEIRQEFALVSDKSYVIPKITIDVFDTTTQKLKQLQSDSVAIEIAQGYEPSNLLDPPTLRDWSTLARYSLYGVLVLAGVALGEGARRLWKLRPRRKAKQFWDEAKSSKELVMLLSLSGDKRYDDVIDELEAGKLDLQEGKKMLDKICFDNKR